MDMGSLTVMHTRTCELGDVFSRTRSLSLQEKLPTEPLWEVDERLVAVAFPTLL